MTYELVSFPICPFVQRSVILLRLKGMLFRTEYIDLDDPPDWFHDLSPFGKVPLLRVGDSVIFESAVINEYLDEVTPPSLHPADPLAKAVNRAWIEFASALLVEFHRLMQAETEADYLFAMDAFCDKLDRVEKQMAGPLFNGEAISLADCAYAPLFMRLFLLEPHVIVLDHERYPGLLQWGQRLLSLPAVRDSVPPSFSNLFFDYLNGLDGYAGRYLPTTLDY